MSKFADFHNISARLDTLIQNNINKEMRVPISNKHLIFMSISRIGLFKTGGIEVDLVSISKFGALFTCAHHALHNAKNKDFTMELVLNDKRFQYQAHIVSQDNINNFYGIKFEQSADVIEDYLIEFRLHPYHQENVSDIGAVWLELAKA